MAPPTQEAINELIEEVDALAPLPGVARRVIQVTDGDRFSANDLAGVLATDAALTAKLLRLGNSAFYGYARRITTVRDAVILLGFREVRATAIATSIMDLFPGVETGPFSVDLFWGHSVAAGVMAEVLAKETGYAKPEEAFTAGVLHDIGRLVLTQYRTDLFGEAVWHALGERIPLRQAEQERLGYDHAEVGALLAERWNFPEELCLAIGEHEDLDRLDEQNGLSFVVALANAFCHQLGLWCGLDTDDGARIHRGTGISLPPDREELYQVVRSQIGGPAGIRERVGSSSCAARGRRSPAGTARPRRRRSRRPRRRKGKRRPSRPDSRPPPIQIGQERFSGTATAAPLPPPCIQALGCARISLALPAFECQRPGLARNPGKRRDHRGHSWPKYSYTTKRRGTRCGRASTGWRTPSRSRWARRGATWCWRGASVPRRSPTTA